ncbi:MAG: threonine/serine exporter family protein [bacterium]|nr:threonine/serine exporter family protein [bacterium]
MHVPLSPHEIIQKPPLPHEELTDVIKLAMWAGQLLLQYGADTARIEETIHRIGTALGCDWLDIIILPEGIIATTVSGTEFRTKVRRVVRMTVNFSVLDEINHLSYLIVQGKADRFVTREELRRISDLGHSYNRWVVVGMVGLGCSALSRLIGGDFVVFLVTFFASAGAMFIRQELHKRHMNMMIVVVTTSFVAQMLASVGVLLNWGNNPRLAMAASVLLLVPGVPLVNSAQDIFQGFFTTGISRAINGTLITLGIAVGVVFASSLLRLGGF